MGLKGDGVASLGVLDRPCDSADRVELDGNRLTIEGENAVIVLAL